MGWYSEYRDRKWHEWQEQIEADQKKLQEQEQQQKDKEGKQ